MGFKELKMVSLIFLGCISCQDREEMPPNDYIRAITERKETTHKSTTVLGYEVKVQFMPGSIYVAKELINKTKITSIFDSMAYFIVEITPTNKDNEEAKNYWNYYFPKDLKLYFHGAKFESVTSTLEPSGQNVYRWLLGFDLKTSVNEIEEVSLEINSPYLKNIQINFDTRTLPILKH